MPSRYFLFGLGAMLALFFVVGGWGGGTVAAGERAAPPAAAPVQGTPTPTPTVVCAGITYQLTATTGATLIQATADIGNHCDDCGTTVNLPFPVTVYGTSYTSVVAGSNGTLDFGSSQANGVNHDCLPVHPADPVPFVAALFPYYDDLRTDVLPSTHGIYSITLGAAPNRQFVLQWHTTYFFSDSEETNFEVVLSENSPVLTVIYGTNAPVSAGAAPATGIQLNLEQYTAYSCHMDLPAGLQVDYVPVDCPLPPSPTATATCTAAPAPTNTPTPPPAPTQTPGGPSATPTATAPPEPSATPGGPAPVVTSAGAQQAPRISNHILVYEDNSSGDWDILAKELTTQQIYPVYRGPGDQRAPAISGDLVVWQDNRNGKWDVYGRHLSGGGEFPIAIGPGDHSHPRVSGAQVVWENSLGGGPTSIVTQNLTTGQPFTLSVAGTTNLAPDLNGTLVVWQSTAATSTLALPGAGAGWQVVGYDLRTGQARPLSSGPGDHTAPSVDNTSVVWVTTLNPSGAAPFTTDSTIDGVDIGGGRGTPTPIPVTVLNPGHHVSQPRVKGHQVTFVDETVDARGVIVGTSLDNVSAATTLSAPGRDSRDPDIDDGGFVVWRQTGGPSDTHIYGTGCQPTAYTDVQVTDYFFPAVQWLTCVGALGGYADGSFRPYANTTRGQLAKIIAGAEGWAITTTGGPHFSDVPASNPFYPFIETAYNHGVISGYADGTFRWGANVTRGQLSKIIVGAQNWTIATTGGPHFSDVPAGNPFYPFVETAFNHGVISGYADGTFRVGANATRGQISKIVYFALTAR